MSVGVVLVTFNRLDKLKISLQKYDMQTTAISYMIVVNNNSTDGTKEYLEEWKKIERPYRKYVVTLPTNTGGAGGFYAGMEHALKLDADWVWLSDDDAYPHPDCIEKLLEFYGKLSAEKQNETVSLCAAVYNNGKIHEGHRNHLKVTQFKATLVCSATEEYQKEAFQIDIFSYVGAMVKKSILTKVGLDRKDFFIYCDDQEHAIRVSKAGRIYCVPAARVDHDTPPIQADQINWGRYYKKRNDLLMRRYNFPYRYFLLKFVKGYIKDVSCFSSKPNTLKKVLKAAYHDAWRNRTGMHEIYKPGWKPDEEH